MAANDSSGIHERPLTVPPDAFGITLRKGERHTLASVQPHILAAVAIYNEGNNVVYVEMEHGTSSVDAGAAAVFASANGMAIRCENGGGTYANCWIQFLPCAYTTDT